jgi:2-phospho-L-lactate guanylyltransferase
MTDGGCGVYTVVPVKDLSGTKSRLAPVLDPAARAGLTLYMMGRVVTRALEAGVDAVGVVSPDPIVLDEALRRGATPLAQKSRGLNPALEEGRLWATENAGAAGAPIVVSPDGARSGTNALLLRPPDALPFLFGPNSFEAHLQAARDRGAEARLCENGHLSFDLDTAGDLAKYREEGAGEA